LCYAVYICVFPSPVFLCLIFPMDLLRASLGFRFVVVARAPSSFSRRREQLSGFDFPILVLLPQCEKRQINFFLCWSFLLAYSPLGSSSTRYTLSLCLFISALVFGLLCFWPRLSLLPHSLYRSVLPSTSVHVQAHQPGPTAGPRLHLMSIPTSQRFLLSAGPCVRFGFYSLSQ
jgi:hypothetical protein